VESRVPVTAKLSRKFYERFGDDITGELVDWFNAVDTTYQQQLRELNDLSWDRFKAHLDGELGKVRGELRTEMANMRANLRTGTSTMGASLRTEMANMRADLIKWMFVFWVGNVVTLGGLMVALLRFGQR